MFRDFKQYGAGFEPEYCIPCTFKCLKCAPGMIKEEVDVAYYDLEKKDFLQYKMPGKL